MPKLIFAYGTPQILEMSSRCNCQRLMPSAVPGKQDLNRLKCT